MSEASARAMPDEVVEKSQCHVLDTLAAMISGSELPPGRLALVFAREYGGKEVATVVSAKLLSGPIEAALTNAMLAHSDETDDSHPGSQSHPGCAVIPAALALGTIRYQRKSFSARRSVGYDVGRGSPLLWGNATKARNASQHAQHCSAFGAAAAAGCAAGFERDCDCCLATPQQCSGLTSWRRDSEHVQKAFVSGMNARSGVTSTCWCVVDGQASKTFLRVRTTSFRRLSPRPIQEDW